MHGARVVARNAPRQMLARSLHKQERGEAAVHHQGGIALDVPRIGEVIMYAMGIEGQRGIAEQEHGIGGDGMRPFRLGWVRRGLRGRCDLRRGRAGCMGRAVDDVLLLGQQLVIIR